jgi:hypothetical protein
MRLTRKLVARMIMGTLILVLMAGGFSWLASAGAKDTPKSEERDNDEVAKLYDADQADRKTDKAVDWEVVLPRDRQREARVKALYEKGQLRTGKDYYRAAMVLQHASKPEDFLLAHEFCMVALLKGERGARWLACATEDRFLMMIGRPQRFGTQYRGAVILQGSTAPDQPVKLYEVGPGVTDGLRRELGVPSLAEARKREGLMNDLLQGKPPARPKS